MTQLNLTMKDFTYLGLVSQMKFKNLLNDYLSEYFLTLLSDDGKKVADAMINSNKKFEKSITDITQSINNWTKSLYENHNV